MKTLTSYHHIKIEKKLPAMSDTAILETWTPGSSSAVLRPILQVNTTL